MITFDDFVMLGTTVPEPRSDGRVFVCSAGVSDQLGSLLRIYPLARSDIPHRWHTYQVSLVRPPPGHDSRHESWQIAGDRTPSAHGQINRAFTEVAGKPMRREARPGLLNRFQVDSIKEANERKLSLAIVHPAEPVEVVWDRQPESEESPQLALFDEHLQMEGSKRFEWIPRLHFKDGSGDHRLMLRDWGTFELIRKDGYDYAKEHLSNALHLNEDSVLLVGNLNNQRNAWLVVSVLSGVIGQTSLFQGMASPDQPARKGSGR